MTAGSCMPIVRNTPFSTITEKVPHVADSCARRVARMRTWLRLPITRPVTTTATTPEPRSDSAARNETNGVASEMAVSIARSPANWRMRTVA